MSFVRPLLFVSFTATLVAHDVVAPAGWKAKLYADVHAHAPSPLTDRVVLTWNGDPAYDPAIGTVYVVSVSGPKLYVGEVRDFAKRIAYQTHLFQVITIDEDELRYSALTATGALYDAFTLKKRPGRPNELRELLPPEVRRPTPRVPPAGAKQKKAS
jgi:hypothetical protein